MRVPGWVHSLCAALRPNRTVGCATVFGMIRITGGEWRGRGLATPAGEKTRPTSAKLRQALFNTLQGEIPGSRVLDLFSGSGALGLEALSRGADSVVFLEQDRNALRVLQKNIETLGASSRSEIIKVPVEKALVELSARGPFDVVLADPPYAGGYELWCLENLPWDRILRPGGTFCLEWGTRKSQVDTLPDSSHDLMKVRERDYGDSRLTHYIKNEINEKRNLEV